jgi:multidrug efflux pump
MVLSDISIRRPVFAIVINLVVLLVGIISFQRLAVRLIPNVDVPVVTVNTSYPGASAQVIESQVTQPIEDALSGVEGIEYMQSTSREQSSQVTIRFRLNRDPDAAASDVRDRVAQARGFLPEEADESIIQKQEADQQPIIYLAFSSDRHSQVEITDYAERLVKDRVQTIPGVAQAQVYGSTFAMRVWLQPQRLAGFGLTPQDVEDALRKQNVEIPAGRVEGSEREFTVLSETDLKTPEEFGNIILSDTGGTLVRLRDVARVELGQQENRFVARYNGKNAVPLGIVKQAVANPLDISDALEVMLPQITRGLPQGMKVEIAYDSTIFIRHSIKEVYRTVLEAIALVIVVIFLFLRSWRAVLIPLVTIPLSLVGAFALMYMFGFTINTLTLLAMVLAIGLVVDDAIVMLENIYRHVEEGRAALPGRVAGQQGNRLRDHRDDTDARRGVRAARVLHRAHGQAVRRIRAHARRRGARVRVHGVDAVADDGVQAVAPRNGARPVLQLGRTPAAPPRYGYRAVLTRALSLKWWVVALGVAVFAAAFGAFILLPKELAPQEDQGFIMGMGIAPEGSTVEYTDKYARQMEGMLLALPDQQRVFQIVGFPDVTQTIGFVMLKDWKDRKESAQAIAGSPFPPSGLAAQMFFAIPGVMASRSRRPRWDSRVSASPWTSSCRARALGTSSTPPCSA